MHAVVWNFVDLLRDAAPWFLIGAVAGAALEAFVPSNWVVRWMGSHRASVFNAAIAGAVLPGCSITTMPLAAALKTQGARLGTLTAFIMISPILSPETIVLTAAMLGTKLAVTRIILPVAVTVVLGLAVNMLEARKVAGFQLPGRKSELSATASLGTASHCDDNESGGTSPAQRFVRSFFSLLHPLWIYFVLGLVAVAVLQAVVPQQTIARYLHGGWWSYAFAALFGIPVYVCEGAEVPLTYSLIKLGVGIGPAFTFLLSAVGTCIPTLAMAPRIIGLAATYVYVAAWLVLAIGGGLVVSLTL